MISKDEVLRVAHLARLELESAEVGALTDQLSSILDYVNQLSELDVSRVAPTTRAIEVSNVTRSDTLIPYENRAGLLAIAPDREDEFFRVPKIM
ncbi:Asp-tRNA(Asn)/Glu-tRNA(Gln) amidotransferase subunit GatC [Candidatus Synechococcus calcipolaris G9]|uniref:Aspartyl/glutamyl-tRNA(Asn/Gln) amidotransferase subunit C n=1 Tax=Candidatus Synechococcus calcipolaris G9 TaxID=1497997 RepID=A0ABT6EX62_9SYNE|nr:Asp-tRNA(Asn)/Glu-tRNA(Gln) amidotransferase subunit GatC [Candidatus Synechococcus calcipolaris]MDG2990390.1 Asp-tRNA(Asn)/Glu-tRNA(Gln) amidotransferase subunit GatC [Candidatus Synechococcus calcipolaris G9]